MDGPSELKVYIIYYSNYGHVQALARTFKATAESITGVRAWLFRVPEVLPQSVLTNTGMPEPLPEVAEPDPPAVPELLPQADGLVFGFPVWYGMMPAAMKAFFDATGALWQRGALHGKPAALLVSGAAQCGGQETAAAAAVTQLAHHGMIFVPTGYAAGGAMFGMEEAKGGSPWGAGTLAGPDGSRQPSEAELEAVRAQARHFAEVVRRLSS